MNPFPGPSRDPLRFLRPQYCVPPRKNFPCRKCAKEEEAHYSGEDAGTSQPAYDRRAEVIAGRALQSKEIRDRAQAKKSKGRVDRRKSRTSKGKRVNRRKKSKKGKATKKEEKKEEKKDEERTGYEGFTRKKELTSKDTVTPERRKTESKPKEPRNGLVHPSERRVLFRHCKPPEGPSIDWDECD